MFTYAHMGFVDYVFASFRLAAAHDTSGKLLVLARGSKLTLIFPHLTNL